MCEKPGHNLWWRGFPPADLSSFKIKKRENEAPPARNHAMVLEFYGVVLCADYGSRILWGSAVCTPWF